MHVALLHINYCARTHLPAVAPGKEGRGGQDSHAAVPKMVLVKEPVHGHGGAVRQGEGHPQARLASLRLGKPGRAEVDLVPGV